MPEKESDHLTPATRLLEKRREMSEVEQALATQKEVSLILFRARQNIVTINFYAGVSNEDGNTSAKKRRARKQGTKSERISAEV